MTFSLARSIESPCRTCENIHLNKEECSEDCERLHAFQEAILRHDERSIKDFGGKLDLAVD